MIQKIESGRIEKLLRIFLIGIFCGVSFFIGVFVYDIFWFDPSKPLQESFKEYVASPYLSFGTNKKQREPFDVMADSLQKQNNTYNAFIGPITLKFNEDTRTIDGKFTIENYSEEAIAGATYSVYITSNKKGKFPEFYFDKQTFPAFNIPAKEILDAEFSYKVHPSFSASDAGIQIELSSEGGGFINRGFSENSTSISSLTKAHLVVPVNALLKSEFGTEYYIGSGPAIYENLKPKSLFLHFSVQNLSDQEVSFSPEIDIYSFADEGKPIKTVKLSDIYTVEPKTTSSEIVIPVPNMDFAPDVYSGRIILKNIDSSNSLYHPDFIFRWMVGGEVAKIQDIISQDDSFRKGEPIKMLLKYTGTPVDIYFNPEIQDPAVYQSSDVSNREALFRAVILDKTGKEKSVLSEKKVQIYNASSGDIGADTTKELLFEVIPLTRSSQLSIKASLYSVVDNRLLDEKIVPIITPLGNQSKYKYEWYIWCIVLLIGGVIFLGIRKGKNIK